MLPPRYVEMPVYDDQYSIPAGLRYTTSQAPAPPTPTDAAPIGKT